MNRHAARLLLMDRLSNIASVGDQHFVVVLQMLTRETDMPCAPAVVLSHLCRIAVLVCCCPAEPTWVCQ